MKWILSVLFTLVTSVMSVPVVNDADATITSYDYQLRENGYSFSYDTSNGITRKENANWIRNLNNKDDENPVIRVNGYYSYIDKDNNMYEVYYIADNDGFKTFKKPPTTKPTGVILKSFDIYDSKEQMEISSAALASLGGN
ncbi:cuticle protein CP14.6-like isoform X2 [Coccinella septempunctata]|uniref:cuticle protein CP14.6-like isoform X2 n=1 Tax=Coccinella septempunctata TaxID=41139 RepID=UPI001D06D7EB|nr:cuticle protein CP14.6-like isoform X2 [Coccinella septempunctata]